MDHRRILRINLANLMQAGGHSVKNPPAIYYVSGVKKGKRVSARTIQYILSPDDRSPSPSLDTIAALARAFKLQTWQMLVPGLPPGDAFRLVSEREFEAEVAARVAERMQTLQRQFSALLQGNDASPDSNDAGASAGNETPSPGENHES